MTNPNQTLETCNALLRGEISAVETYTQAIEKFDVPTSDTELDRIREVHQQNAFELRKYVTNRGGEPSSGSGVWGGFVQAIEGTASLLGESPALKILQTGENHGISQYENALANEDVCEDAKSLIRKVLLPSLSGHLIALQQRRDHVA